MYFTSDGDNVDWELFDLQVDPDEDYTVAGQSRYGDIQLKLETKLQNIMQKMKTLPGEFKWPPKATPKSQGDPPVIHNSIKLVDY
jgi:hypothetical protein